MPELPEVETTMRGMAAPLVGQVIADVELRRADLRWAIPPGLVAAARGARVVGLARRGKYILIRLDHGAGLLLHLGMSGRMVISAPEVAASVHPHEHVVLHTAHGWRLGLVDPRRFGALDLIEPDGEAIHRLLAALGPEPLGEDFTDAVLAASLAGRRAPLKALLLDQRLIAGLGNIYVCEALFAARLSPFRSGASLGVREIGRLRRAIVNVLTAAVAAGGSSLRDYVQPNGELGYFQAQWQVYGREGERCSACEAKCPGIRREVQSGRSTFFCERAQR